MIEKHRIAQTSRATRTDKGMVRLTPRDLDGLRFCAVMRAVRLDHLARWFAPDLVPAQKEEQSVPAYPPGQKRSSLSWPRDPDKRLHATYNIVSRWVKAGFAQTRAPYLHQPRWVALTARGVQQFGLAYDTTFPTLVELEHLYQITHVRLTLAYLARQHSTKPGSIPVHTWISERELAARQEEREAGIPIGHRPDGALLLQDGTLEAVEIELSPKPYAELHRILYELTSPASAYTRVRYFVGGKTLHTVLQAHAQLEPEQQERVVIMQL